MKTNKTKPNFARLCEALKITYTPNKAVSSRELAAREKEWGHPGAHHYNGELARVPKEGSRMAKVSKGQPVVFWRGWYSEGPGHAAKPAPDAADVMHAVVSDAQCVDPEYCGGFADFCENLGYDYGDSIAERRKARGAFDACEAARFNLYGVFSPSEIQALYNLAAEC